MLDYECPTTARLDRVIRHHEFVVRWTQRLTVWAIGGVILAWLVATLVVALQGREIRL